MRELIGYPPRVTGIDKNSIAGVIFGKTVRHHIERRLSHIGVDVPRELASRIEPPLDRADVDDKFIDALIICHTLSQTVRQQKRRGHVDKLNLQQLLRGYLLGLADPRIIVRCFAALREPVIWHKRKYIVIKKRNGQQVT